MEEEGDEEETKGGERTLVRCGVLPGKYLRKQEYQLFHAALFRDDILCMLGSFFWVCIVI